MKGAQFFPKEESCVKQTFTFWPINRSVVVKGLNITDK